MTRTTVLFAVHDHIATVTLDRPGALNAYDDVMQGELAQVWREIRANDDIWAVVLTGTGSKAFCAGRDVKELSRYQQSGELVPRYDPSSPTFNERGAHLHRYDILKPVVGAINGLAIGGGLGLALSCDVRVMSETAWLADLHANAGQVGGVARIVQHLPYVLAAELILTGGRLSAQRAYEVGLVNKVSPPERVVDDASEIAERICTLSPLAVKRSKEIMLAMLRNSAGVDLLEEHYSTTMRETEDGREGPLALREKRKPRWTGR